MSFLRFPSSATAVALSALLALGGCLTHFDFVTPGDAAAEGQTSGEAGLDATADATADADVVSDLVVADMGPDADAATPVDADAAGDGWVDPCTRCRSDLGESCCAGRCVVVQSDTENCGACGNSCAGQVCLGGTCTNTCVRGRLDCDGNVINGCEVNAATDDANCGSCGRACPAGRSCNGGTCQCPAGRGDCDGNPANGCETDLTSDATRCGACTTRCTAGQSCTAGTCGCAPGRGDCNGNTDDGCETDLATNDTHCGACATACDPGEACTAGACGCREGRLRCPATAADCTVSATDPDHCGTCDTVCPATARVCTTAGCGTACAGTETLCGASCKNLLADRDNCGACGAACAGGQMCSGSSPAACVCAPGMADCNRMTTDGCEADLSTSAANCGGCGNACAAGQVCVAGLCQCPTGMRDCGGTCAACCGDTDCNDGDGCTTDRCTAGVCSHAGCGAGTRCCGGVSCKECCTDGDCTAANVACGMNNTCTACRTGFADCNGDLGDGCEADLSAPASCGACGVRCAFDNAAAGCTMGRCTLGACNAGFGDCDGNPSNGCETNLNVSPANCGACGSRCRAPTGRTATCSGGTCSTTMCTGTLGDCDGNPSNGCETDLSSSVSHCGACGSGCSYPNGTAACRSGTCALASCTNGYGDCDGNAGNGCETALSSSIANCGVCGNACSLSNATATCTAGQCAVLRCATGYSDCDGVASNGCETLLGTPSACGGCNVCPSRPGASATCSGGVCGFTCDPNAGDCDGDATNGCETNLQTSALHCGGCGNDCPVIPGGTPVCSGGSCAFTCGSGYHACGSSCASNSSTASCGTACTPCAVPANATATCNGTACGYTCLAGYGDCDGNAANGCETNLQNSASNCGTCRTACTYPNATGSCAVGTCTLAACSAGFGNCDGSAANGCETNLTTSVAHCGVCGNACTAAGAICSGGVCGVGTMCPTGLGNCDGNAANGCETDVRTSNANCGACGSVCALANATSNCTNGACALVSCASGYANCDNVTSNGCEANLQNGVTTCGACGTTCVTANGVPACVSGACTLGSCNSGYHACGNVCASNTNPASCGTSCTPCAPPANATATCNGTSCGFTCNAGYHNCSGACVSNSSVSSCGGSCSPCSSRANATTTCNGTSCGFTCNAGWGDCDSSSSNGCEVDLANDPRYCGGTCSGYCSAGNYCRSGTCVADAVVGASSSLNGNTTCAWLQSGMVKCWGSGNNGLLGNGSTSNATTPIFVPRVFDAISVSVGTFGACAVRKGGSLWCWGRNDYGEFGNGQRSSAIVGPTAVDPGITVQQLAMGTQHACALANGGVYCWGSDGVGQLGPNGPGAADAGTSDAGTVFSGPVSVPVTLIGTATLVEVAVTGGTSCVRASNGSVYCWGSNENGQLGIGDMATTSSRRPNAVVGVSGATVLKAGSNFFCVLQPPSAPILNNGAVACWGGNTYGQAGTGSTNANWSAASTSFVLAVDELIVGGVQVCLRFNLRLRCAGSYYYGGFGDGQTGGYATSFTSPGTDVSSLGTTPRGVSGSYFLCGGPSDGSRAFCTGRNDIGQLGIGSTSSQSSFQRVQNLP